MAHEISTVTEADGRKVHEAAFFKSLPWHDHFNRIFEEEPTREEMQREAHLNWLVRSMPMYAENPVTGDRETSDRVWLYRDDNGAKIGEVGKDYPVVQNDDLFDFVESLRIEGQMTYESAFALRGGKTVVVLARLPQDLIIGTADRVFPYLSCSNANDGTQKFCAYPTTVREVCANTHKLALDTVDEKKLYMVHRGNMTEKMEEARRVLQVASAAMQRWAALGTELARAQITESEIKRFIESCFPLPADTDAQPRIAKSVLDTRLDVYANFKKPETDEATGSYWGAFNAVTRYFDHGFRYIGRDAETRSERRIYGTLLEGIGVDAKRNAFDVAVAMAGVTAPMSTAVALADR